MTNYRHDASDTEAVVKALKDSSFDEHSKQVASRNHGTDEDDYLNEAVETFIKDDEYAPKVEMRPIEKIVKTDFIEKK